VEGIETGIADRDNDGAVSVDELHEYARSKVQEVAPSMKPEIYAVKEGFKIRLAQTPVTDPKLRYRKEVERVASNGEISNIGRTTLEVRRNALGLSLESAAVVEIEVLAPQREYRQKLQHYRQTFDEATQREFPLGEHTQNELKLLQQILNLKDKDIAAIEERIVQRARASQLGAPSDPSTFPLASTKSSGKSWLLPGLGITAIAIGSAVTYPSAQKELILMFQPVSAIQGQSQQAIQPANVLSKAQALAEKHQLTEAIVEAGKISPSDASYPAAHNLIAAQCLIVKKEYIAANPEIRQNLGESDGEIRHLCLTAEVEISEGGK
jgi:hypothetical protein